MTINAFILTPASLIVAIVLVVAVVVLVVRGLPRWVGKWRLLFVLQSRRRRRWRLIADLEMLEELAGEADPGFEHAAAIRSCAEHLLVAAHASRERELARVAMLFLADRRRPLRLWLRRR